MEKDYFKDRPDSVQYRENVSKGTKVFVCEKQAQKYAKELNDLTLIEVTANLTSQSVHPRGQKVKGTKKARDRFGNELYEGDGEDIVGRCTYIVGDDEETVDTSEGKKYLKIDISTGQISLIPPSEAERGYRLAIEATFGNEVIRICPFRYLFFETKKESLAFAKRLKIGKIKIGNNSVIIEINGNAVISDAVNSRNEWLKDGGYNEYWGKELVIKNIFIY